jgi:hypothetical protein
MEKGLVMMKDSEMIKKTIDWIENYLEPPHPNFGDMPICPFIQAEKSTTFVAVWYPDETKLTDLIDEYLLSGNSSALFICAESKDFQWRRVKSGPFQKELQKKLFKIKMDQRVHIFSPFEYRTLAGINSRKGIPYVLLNISSASKFNEAHRSLWKTDYFKNWSDEERRKIV